VTDQADLPRVTVFSLGGTIASTKSGGNAGGGVSPRLGARELVDAVPQLQEVAELETVPFRQKASGDLLAAVQVAAAPEAAGLGTLVVLNDEIHAARFVRKTHASSPATFRSPTAGPLGWVVEGRPRIALRVPVLQGVPTGVGEEVPAVALLTCALGEDSRLIGHLEELGYAGLVLDAFGGGHVPAHVVPALEDLATRIPVVLGSRTGGGEMLRATYGFPGSERDLLARGLVPAGFLDGRKARVLLSLLLAAGSDLDGVRTSFELVNASACSGTLDGAAR
jgi:L-asparaginase